MDGKSLGIVLTPPHIISLMIDLLDLNETDIFLDICSGTGSFALEAYRKCNVKMLISCEYQTKLYNLLRCNMVIRRIPPRNFLLYHGDCFDYTFSATKSAINPPYGMRGKQELDFVQKQLDSLQNGSLLVAIFPISCLKKTPLRQRIITQAKIKRLILCNEQLFYNSNAGVRCVIVLFEKCSDGHISTDPVLFFNYEDDGYEIRRTYGRVKTPRSFECYSQVLLESKPIFIDPEDNHWLDYEVESTFDVEQFRKTCLQIQFLEETLRHASVAAPQPKRVKKFHITDLFEVQKVPTIPCHTSEKVFLISAKNNNNGVKEITKAFPEKTFPGNQIILVTSGNGGAGLAYYQPQPFMITSATLVLNPKFVMDRLVGIYIAQELSKYKKKYSRGFGWTLERIAQDTIILPVTDIDEIDANYIQELNYSS
jgi:predicted RNA methylase